MTIRKSIPDDDGMLADSDGPAAVYYIRPDEELAALVKRHFVNHGVPSQTGVQGNGESLQRAILQHEQVEEFVRAVDLYKQENLRKFPTLGELFLVMYRLGYRKIV